MVMHSMTRLKSFFRVEGLPVSFPAEGGLLALGQQALATRRQLEEDVLVIYTKSAKLNFIPYQVR
jgi:hypothetical protein